jgi:hypothetical protein
MFCRCGSPVALAWASVGLGVGLGVAIVGLGVGLGVALKNDACDSFT